MKAGAYGMLGVAAVVRGRMGREEAPDETPVAPPACEGGPSPEAHARMRVF